MDKFFENSSTTIAAIKDALVPVAAKIGQGAEYAWGVVVKQQYVEGITGLVFSLGLIVILLITAYSLYRAAARFDNTAKRMREDKETKRSDRENMEGLALAFGVGSIITLVVTVLFSAMGFLPWAYHSTLQLYNPDYYALQFFIDMAKPAVR